MRDLVGTTAQEGEAKCNPKSLARNSRRPEWSRPHGKRHYFLGVVTLILGVIVSFHPSGSLNVIAVLLGILMIISGIFHLIRVFDNSEPHRVWLGIAGLLFIVIGVVLIRHLHLTIGIIGLIIGIVWIVQGLVSLIAGLSGGAREGRAGGSSLASSA